METPQKLKNFMLWEEIKPHIGKKLDLTDLLRNFVIAQFHLYQKPITKDDSKQLSQCAKKYLKYVKKQYIASAYKEEEFKRRCNQFLASDFPYLPKYANSDIAKEVKPLSPFAKLLPYREKKERAKRLETAKIRQENDSDAIVQSSIQILKGQGKKAAVEAIENTFLEAPTQSTSKDKNHMDNISIRETTPEEALCILLNNNMTVETYKTLRRHAIGKGAGKIYPSYHNLLNEKKKCTPTNLHVNPTESWVDLQDLLDHTTSRTLNMDSVYKKLIEKHNDCNDIQLVHYVKWGIDGAGSFFPYNQGGTDTIHSQHLLASHLVSLQISSLTTLCTVFTSENVNSALACRPIRLSFEKETEESVMKEYNRIVTEINSLQSFKMEIPDGPRVVIQYKLLCTMIDGKTLNFLVNNKSSRSCPICLAGPKALSKRSGSFDPLPGTLIFGVSPLHWGMRIFEFLLHISYNSDFRKAEARSSEEKALKKTRQEEVRKKFLDKLSLRIDTPCSRGGNCNSGNVARRAFANAGTFSEITGIPISVIEGFGVLWSAIRSGQRLDDEKFEAKCNSVLDTFFASPEVNWYGLSPSAHKLLVHGADIIRHSILPVGILAEDPAEGSNKLHRIHRQNHTRKISHETTMDDLISRKLHQSDPIVLSHHRSFKKKNRRPKVNDPFMLPDPVDLLKRTVSLGMKSDTDESSDNEDDELEQINCDGIPYSNTLFEL